MSNLNLISVCYSTQWWWMSESKPKGIIVCTVGAQLSMHLGIISQPICNELFCRAAFFRCSLCIEHWRHQYNSPMRSHTGIDMCQAERRSSLFTTVINGRLIRWHKPSWQQQNLQTGANPSSSHYHRCMRAAMLPFLPDLSLGTFTHIRNSHIYVNIWHCVWISRS